MDLSERVRYLRKDKLRMSRVTFGKKLGVSQDVINNIENNRLARPDQKLSLIKLMCKEFSVNEDWLLNGTGPMFIEEEAFSLNSFAAQHGASDLELEILKAYFEIEPETRRKLIEHFRSRLTGPSDDPAELEKRYPPDGEGGEKQTG